MPLSIQKAHFGFVNRPTAAFALAGRVNPNALNAPPFFDVALKALMASRSDVSMATAEHAALPDMANTIDRLAVSKLSSTHRTSLTVELRNPYCLAALVEQQP